MATSKKKDKAKSPFKENIEVISFAIVMALGLKVFALEAYQIPTGSMQPTLMGTQLLDKTTKQPSGRLNDRVLVDKVSYFFRDPKRWEVVVFRYPLLTHVNYVKRLVGMPGEQLQIEGGNLYARPIDSKEDFKILRKPWKVMSALWKRVLPSIGNESAKWAGWRISGNYLQDENNILRFTSKGAVEYSTSIRNGYLDGYPEEVFSLIPNVSSRSREVVSDLRIKFDLHQNAPKEPFIVNLELGEHLLNVYFGSDKKVTVELPDGSKEMLSTIPSLKNIEIAFWDDTFRIASDNREFFTKELTLKRQKPRKNRINFLAESGWGLSPVYVDRDLHYLPPRQNAAPIFDITAGHYFMLGDNTQNSLDSRDWQMETFSLPKEDGTSLSISGDYLQHGADPMYNNPRWDIEHKTMTFRDIHGNLHTLKENEVRSSANTLQHYPLVPREYMLGRALAVFMPIKPFSPTNRFSWVQ